MIISEDDILQEDLNNLTRILLVRAYPLHLIIKNRKTWSTIAITCYPLCVKTQHTGYLYWILPPLLRFAIPSARINNNLCITRYPGCRRFPYDEQVILIFYYTVLSLSLEKSSNTRITINICPPHPLIQ